MTQQSARWIAGLALVAAGFWILHGFLIALAWAVVIAVATWGVYGRFLAVLGERLGGAWSATLFTLLLAALVVGPFAYAAVQTGREAQTIAHWVAAAQANGISGPDWLARLPYGDWLTQRWNEWLGSGDATSETLRQLSTGSTLEWTRKLGVHVLHFLVVMAFTLLTLFFLYLNGEALTRRLTRLATNLFGEPGEMYLLHATGAVRATVNGLVIVGLGEGVLLGIAYWVCRLPHPALLGALTGVLAMIPFAAPLVYGAAAVYLVVQGSTAAGITLAVFGSVVLFIADHFVRPMIIGGAAKLPFLWVLLGILGGLEAFHLLGLFLGPTIMALLIALWREWTEREASGDSLPVD